VKRVLIANLIATGALLVSACGSTSSPSAAASSPSPAASPAVLVATATVAGTSEQILTNPAGMTVYYLTSDNATAPKCAGACLTHWPPLLSTGGQLALAAGVSGTLTAVQNPNGNQVAYNGHLLYSFANDKAPGDTKGEGINAFGGTWHVATPGLTAM
jgi:predicted lipoprotein with Yx(FWY)xxD motif